MASSAVFEYAYRNPNSDIAFALFSADDEYYESFGVGSSIINFFKETVPELAGKGDAAIKQWFLERSPTEQKRILAELEKQKGINAANDATIKGWQNAYAKMHGETTGIIDRHARTIQDQEKEIGRLRAEDRTAADKYAETASTKEKVGHAARGIKKDTIEGLKAGGQRIGGGIKSLGTKLYEKNRMKLVPLEGEELGGQLINQGRGRKFLANAGLKIKGLGEAAERHGLRTMGAVGVAGAAAAGSAAAIARHAYLKRRMKQTGAKSKAEVKQIIRERKATKRLLKAKGMNKTAIQATLKRQFGY